MPVDRIDFDAFCLGTTGRRPFPWQRQLAEQLAAGSSPQRIAVPTGLGKTSYIVAWAWALSMQSPGPGRKVPMRLVYVAPRRVIVDDAIALADQVASRLADPESARGALPSDADDNAVVEALRLAAARLLAFTGGEGFPLATGRSRGNIPRETAWYGRVDQPTVIVSTAEMAGSGLLFRHWVSSSSVSPIVAGILGVDSAWVVDEAHVQRPLVSTLDRCLGAKWERDLGLPAWRTVMSATLPTVAEPEIQDFPGGTQDELGDVAPLAAPKSGARESTLTITDADQRYPVIARRLAVRRVLDLHEHGSDKKIEELLAGYAMDAAANGAHSVLVTANTVATARKIHKLLLQQVANATGSQRSARQAARQKVLLVHGQQREIDRATVMGVVKRACPMDGTPADGPWFVVATSAIEVGADLSADHLVTESCPYDSLVQRAGRIGRRADKEEYVCDIVSIESDQRKKKKKSANSGTDDNEDEQPIAPDFQTRYATAAKATFSALKRVVGDNTKAMLLADGTVVTDYNSVVSVTDDMRAPTAEPVPLWPEDLFALACTRPRPRSTVDVDSLVNGCDQDYPTVSIAWRSDLSHDNQGQWAKLVHDWPLRPHELVQVPAYEAQELLKKVPVTSIERAAKDNVAPYLLQTGDGWDVRRKKLPWRQATVVVPSSYGGYDQYGFDPGHREPVKDVADWLTEHPNGPRLRLGELPVDLDDEEVTSDDVDAIARDMLHQAAEPLPQDAARDSSIETARELLKLLGDNAADWSMLAGRVVWQSRRRPFQDDGQCYTGRVTLADHRADVATRALAMARRCGVPSAEQERVRRGALTHDEGKANQSLQESFGNNGTPIAKSGLPERKRRTLATQAGVHVGWRHEAISAALASKLADPLSAHLAGASHGWGRPWYRPCPDVPSLSTSGELDNGKASVDGNPYQSRLDLGLVDRFVALHNLYGPWALAWLEATVRLADWEASGAPAISPQAPGPVDTEIVIRDVPSITRVNTNIPMNGLAMRNLTGWLAAVGVLAVCSRHDPGATLRWDGTDVPVPVLSTTLLADQVVDAVWQEFTAVDSRATGEEGETGAWSSLALPLSTLKKHADNASLMYAVPDAVGLVSRVFTSIYAQKMAAGAHQLVAGLGSRMNLGLSIRDHVHLLNEEQHAKQMIRLSIYDSPQRTATGVASLAFDDISPGTATTGSSRIDPTSELLALFGTAACARTAVHYQSDAILWPALVWRGPLSLPALVVLLGWPNERDMASWGVSVSSFRSIKRTASRQAQYRMWVRATSAPVPHRRPGSARSQVRAAIPSVKYALEAS